MYEIKKYPDGTSYVKINKVDYNIPEIIKNVNGSVNPIIFRINNYENLWHLNQLVDAYNNLGIKPDITIPNLIDAQADRRFNDNESFGLKLVCKFLNSMNANFKVFHPHNEAIELLLDSVEIIDNSNFVIDVLDSISNPELLDMNNWRDNKNLILMSTDGGSYKWINKIADKIGFKNEVYGASKMRKYEDEKSKLIQVIDRQDFESKDILVLDDISIYGGTFKGLSKMLKERNCGKLYLAVSHMTIKNLGDDPVTKYFDKVFTTNSKGFDYTIEGSGHDKIGYKPENLEVIKMFD